MVFAVGVPEKQKAQWNNHPARPMRRRALEGKPFPARMKTLLNIASGSTNLLPPVFNFSQEGGGPSQSYLVHNMDIAFTAEAAKSGALAVRADAGKALPYVGGSVNVVLAISPYKLSPVNQEVVRMLKPSGGIIAVGNSSNPYINAKAAESPLVLLSVEELKPGSRRRTGPDCCVHQGQLCFPHHGRRQTDGARRHPHLAQEIKSAGGAGLRPR
jgi:hypothetical protein